MNTPAPSTPQPQPPKDAAQTHFQQGRHERRRGNPLGAIEHFRAAIRLRADFVPAYNNLANALQATGQLAEAKAVYEQALRLAPDKAVLHCNLASLWQIEGDHARAIAGYRQALKLDPALFLAHHNLGKALAAHGDSAAALAAYQAALRLRPDSAEVHLECGNLYQRHQQLREAAAHYRHALRAQPDSARAHNCLGTVLQEWGEFRSAEAHYRHALALQADFDLPHFNLGQVLEHVGHLAGARHHYERALALRPDQARALYHLNHVRQLQADWADYPARMAGLEAAARRHLQDPDAEPLPVRTGLMFPLPQEVRRATAEQVARFHAKAARSQAAPPRHPPRDPRPERLRIGYVSPDFRRHAVGSLIHGIFQHHQRPEFEIFAYSLVPVEDDWTAAIRQGCDHYLDVSRQSPRAIAARIQADGIHILIDLAGYTTHSNTVLFAFKPAPIQIQYLGYPGTMGADFIPHILADDVIIPESHARHYSESIIRLPQAWVASPMPIADTPMRRRDWGLPEAGVVFCCFNGFYKIEPTVFAAWMRILRRVPDSVLWLRDGGDTIKARLRGYAAAARIAPDRLVFAADLPHADYLARYRLADLFLDTLLYNAGATAVGALWAGLPVLTCPGEDYAARMGASLSHAVGLPELVCDSLATYEHRAVDWGTHPERLAALKRKLAGQLPTAPLFQPRQFVPGLEQAFREVWARHCGIG